MGQIYKLFLKNRVYMAHFTHYLILKIISVPLKLGRVKY